MFLNEVGDLFQRFFEEAAFAAGAHDANGQFVERSGVPAHRHGERLVVHGPRGDVELRLHPRFPAPGAVTTSGGLVAPMPGKVIDVRVAVGDSVRAGDTLVVLEAMKMEHPMRAPEDGVVAELRVAVGDQVENGALLLVVAPAEEAAPQGGQDG